MYLSCCRTRVYKFSLQIQPNTGHSTDWITITGLSGWIIPAHGIQRFFTLLPLGDGAVMFSVCLPGHGSVQDYRLCNISRKRGWMFGVFIRPYRCNQQMTWFDFGIEPTSTVTAQPNVWHSFSSITSFLYKVYFKGVSAAQISNKKNSTGCSKGIPNIPTCLHYQKKNTTNCSFQVIHHSSRFCFVFFPSNAVQLLRWHSGDTLSSKNDETILFPYIPTQPVSTLTGYSRCMIYYKA